MFLKELQIQRDSSVIRQIFFHKGINLIVDETSDIERTETGNNVGKTTVLRLIDYCLGGNGTNIYKDTEFKEKANTQVEKFLKENNIIISLILKEDINISTSREIEIRRNFLLKKDRILEINGEKYTLKDFPDVLKRLIFCGDQEKPGLRQIIAKNIRDEKNRLTNTLKVLHPYTTKAEYEALYLYWLGVEIDTNARKQQLCRTKKTEEELINRLKQESSMSQIEQSLIVINRTIDELNAKKNSFDINAEYGKDLSSLNDVQKRINVISTSLSSYKLRRELILESKVELQNEVSLVSGNKIAELYREAKSLIPNLQKSFEDTIAFHNAMINKKMEYITEELPVLERQIENIQLELNELLLQEKKLSNSLKRAGLIFTLEKVIKELNEAYERRGTLEEQKRMWDYSTTRIIDIDTELTKINEGIYSKEILIQERIAEFNKYFSSMSARLYGEIFVLSSGSDPESFELNISSISGNLGTGKKKGQMAAFDLAYIQFADALGINCLHFILQDQIENVHDNQINSLFTEIVSDVNCQYVVPVLRDKLPVDIDVSAYQVISLSQSDKLFRIT